MSTNRNLAARLGGVTASPSPPRPAGKDAAQIGSTAAPPAVTTKFTLLMDAADAAAFDDLHLRIKRETGSRINKSDVVRALLALATGDSTLRSQVVERLGAAQ